MTDKYIDLQTVTDIHNYSTNEQAIISVTFIRMDLYNHGKKYGPKAIQKEMQRLDIKNIPSTATIGRIFRDQYLTNGRTGSYTEDYS